WGLKGPGGGAHQQDGVNVPDLDDAAGEEVGQEQGGGGHHGIGPQHHQAAVPAVYQHAGHGAEQHIGQQGGQGGSGEHGGRAGGDGEPPDQGKLHQRAAEERQRLARPQ